MSTPIIGILILALIALAVYRRMRPQPVQPRRAAILAAIVVLTSLFSLFGTGRLVTHPLAIALAVPALAIGAAAGWAMVRSIHFWHDERSGALWMKGGVLYLAVWLGTLILRQGVNYASGAYSYQAGTTALHHTVNPTLAVLSIDLLFVSMGLWIARATALALRYRAHQRGQAGAYGQVAG